MGLDPRSMALEFICLIDLTVDELKEIQSRFQFIDFDKADDVESCFNWYCLLKKMLEKQYKFILEKTEPVENEYIPN